MRWGLTKVACAFAGNSFLATRVLSEDTSSNATSLALSFPFLFFSFSFLFLFCDGASRLSVLAVTYGAEEEGQISEKDPRIEGT